MGISLKELKKNRLTPTEKWVLETIEGVKPTKYSNDYVDWWKKGKWLFQQDFVGGKLTVIRLNITYYLEKEFDLNDNEIFDLFTNLLYDYTDNGKLKITF